MTLRFCSIGRNYEDQGASRSARLLGKYRLSVEDCPKGVPEIQCSWLNLGAPTLFSDGCLGLRHTGKVLILADYDDVNKQVFPVSGSLQCPLHARGYYLRWLCSIQD
jgi:hypothetical protein